MNNGVCTEKIQRSKQAAGVIDVAVLRVGRQIDADVVYLYSWIIDEFGRKIYHHTVYVVDTLIQE